MPRDRVRDAGRVPPGQQDAVDGPHSGGEPAGEREPEALVGAGHERDA